MKKFIIIHGYYAQKDEHWFPWLRNKIENEKLGEAISITLPNPNNPNVDEWIEAIKDITEKNKDDDLYLIGHSLGCIAILDAISKYKIEVKGIFLVAGFCRNLSGLPQLDPFTNIDLDWDFLKKIKNKFCISAFNDYYFWEETAHLAKQLNSNCLILNKGGHFVQSINIYELPELFAAIKLIK